MSCNGSEPAYVLTCADCGADITGSDDGTGQLYCFNCDEGKDSEHVRCTTADPLPGQEPSA